MISLLLSLLACSLLAVRANPDTLVTKEVFLDISIGDQPAGKIILGVFGNTAPKTVTNFVALATQEASSIECRYNFGDMVYPKRT